MDNSTTDLVSSNGFPFPVYARSLCEKSFKLIQPIMNGSTKEEFLPLLHRTAELFNTDFDKEDLSKITEMSNQIQPLSKLYGSPEKADAYDKALIELAPSGSIMERMLTEDDASVDPKNFLAAAIFSLVIMLAAVEKRMSTQGEPLDFESGALTLEPIAESLRQYYSMLLYLDSELENIKTKLTRVNAAQKKNRPHKEMHGTFFKFYEDNKSQWSKSECARRFYRSLPNDEQRLYTTIEHAKRQLTDALRLHLKS